ncbi:hypothetical protein HA051_11105 [Chromobacterium vaccinii]|nr:hypothetical protein [Chromobacterium vaccinii]
MKVYVFPGQGSQNIGIGQGLSARPYKDSEIILNLRKQLSSSVQWLASIRYLKSIGDVKFEEIGPRTVLKKLIANIKAGK